MIKNVNLGLCHRRIQENRPPYFVNYQINEQNKYVYFSLRFAAEDYKNKLLKQPANQLTTI